MKGGKRAGAGKKATGKYGPKVWPLNIRVSTQVAEKIGTLVEAGVSISDLVEGVIVEAYNRI